MPNITEILNDRGGVFTYQLGENNDNNERYNLLFTPYTEEVDNTLLTERVDTKLTYEDRSKRRMAAEILTLHIEFEDMQDNEETMIHPNQIEAATIIFEAYKNRKITYSQLITEMQSGKTGTMVYLVRLLKEYEQTPNDNIYFITGLSSKEWKEQTKNRLPKAWQNNVYHRNDITKFIRDVGDTNIFFIS